MYYFYTLLSGGVAFAGVIGFWFCILNLNYGDWNMLIGAIVMFSLFGLQDIVNKTKYIQRLKEKLGV